MTLKTDIQSDYTEFDGVETVTITPHNPDAATFEASALRRMMSVGQMAMLGGTLGDEANRTIWEIWQASMPAGKVIETGYEITSLVSGTFIVNDAAYSEQTSRWRCVVSRKR